MLSPPRTGRRLNQRAGETTRAERGASRPGEAPLTPRLRRGRAEALRAKPEACGGVGGAKPLGSGDETRDETRALLTTLAIAETGL
jgi:hypothetical protein